MVFAIWTRRPIFRSRPHVFRTGIALVIIVVTVAFPPLPVGRWFGFVVPSFFVFLIGTTLAYLAIVDKRILYRTTIQCSS